VTAVAAGKSKKGAHTMRLRRIMYSLGWLAAMAVAIGAPFKNN
jgi:hypothetical protein